MTDPRLAGTGDRLIRLRLLRGYERRAHLAPLLGVDVDTLRTHEEGRTIPPSHAVVRLADRLDCTTDYLLVGKSRGMPPETLRALAAITPEQIADTRRRGPRQRKREP
jgi:transcriptional regulator with XRE-family HTH domain